jgi:hypothetical protein
MRIQWSNVSTNFIGIVTEPNSEWLAGMPSAKINTAKNGKLGITIKNPLLNVSYRAVLYLNGVKVATSAPIVVKSSP